MRETGLDAKVNVNNLERLSPQDLRKTLIRAARSGPLISLDPQGLHLVKSWIDREWAAVSHSPAKESPADEPPETKPVAASKQVQLYGPGEQPMVKGKLKPTLTTKRYNTVQALIEAGENGLTKDELDRKSGHVEARKALSDMAKEDDGWRAVIIMPGATGKRYRIR